MQDTNRQPISNDSSSIIQARRQNRFAGIANAVNSATNAYQKKKYDDLKTDVTNISQAQERKSQAKTVIDNVQEQLKQPGLTAEQKAPLVKMLQQAAGVYKSNDEYENKQMSDPKKRKELQKAFDVSFTDPTQNNTPEVKAGAEGIKDAQAAAKAGTTANTPEEKAVQDYLAQQEKGTNSYSQQLDKQTPTQLTANPQYEQQYKDYQAQQKNLTQYILPKIIQGQEARELQEMKASGAMQLEKYKQLNDNIRTLANIKKDLKIADINGQKTVQAALIRAGAEIQRTTMQVNSAFDLATNPQVLSNKLALRNIKDTTLAGLDATIKSSVDQLKILQNQYDTIKSDSPTYADNRKALAAQIKATNISLSYSQEQRERFKKGVEDAESGAGANSGSSSTTGAAGTSGLRTTYDPSDTRSPNYNKDTYLGGESDDLITQALAESDTDNPSK
jgi:hypothetical protein